MGRFILILLLVTSAGGLAAQNTASLNGSVPTDRRLTYLYEIDFGGSSQAWTLNVSLTTNASSGLVVRLIDIDAFASSALANPTSINEGSVAGIGTAPATLNGTYAGLRSFAVEIETATGATASDYSGMLTASVGVVSLLKQDQFVLSAAGLKLAVDHFAFWDASVPQNSTMASSLELDFGASQTVFVRFEGIGNNIEKIEFIDTTGGTGTVLATFTNPSAGQVTSVPLTHSGKATLRVNVKSVSTSAGSASWAVTMPSTVTLSLVGVPSGGGGNDCSTHAGGLGWLMLLGLAAAAITTARLRREG